MADSTALDSFIAAQNFCTGSQTDYSTCIANNMRFTPFLDDTYQASGYAGLSINDQDIPLLFGDVYTDLIPLAISNIFTRIKMTNSYGGVSFRCSEVFNRPRLPLPSLQDLGIPSQELVNIVGVDPTEPEEVDNSFYFEGIPISPDETILGYMYNYMNLLIGYTTSVANTITKGKEVKGIILGSLNYYSLPALADEMDDEADKSLAIYNEAIRYITLVYNDQAATPALKSLLDVIRALMLRSEGYMMPIRSSITSDIVAPLSIITENTDFATFDFTITDDVATKLTELETDYFPFVFSFAMQAKLNSTVYGVPPVYPKDSVLVSKKVVDNYGGTIRNLVSDSLTTISKLYGATTTMESILAQLRGNEVFWLDTVADAFFYIDEPRSTIPSVDETDIKYHTVINQLETVINTFSFGGIMDTVEALYDPEDYDSVELVSQALDTYFDTIGNTSNIELYALIDDQQALYNTTIDDRITEVFLGGDYADSGKMVYADVAYAVGYAKLTSMKSIQINDEYYELTAIVDEDGNPLTGISESGCTKYTFTRHVLPTYDVEVEMYVYPGTPDQPYCPTINKYHNYLSSKYYGMFTKMDGEEMGVYIYRGYKPMFGTVDEIVQIGKMDLNSINLNDPSLDQKSYEAMLMKEVKNLTNSDSIDDGPVSTEDLKYYLASTIVDEDECSNYPGLAIIEFKQFPLGESTSFPKIKVNVVSEDLVI